MLRTKAESRQRDSQNGKVGDHPPYSAGQIFQMAANEEPISKEVVKQVSKHLGWAIKLLVLSYDVELIIFGGGVARAGVAFLDPILQDVKRQRQESDLAREMLHLEMVQLLPNDFEAPLWGGIALAEEGLGKRQKT
jgi:glucokinase